MSKNWVPILILAIHGDKFDPASPDPFFNEVMETLNQILSSDEFKHRKGQVKIAVELKKPSDRLAFAFEKIMFVGESHSFFSLNNALEEYVHSWKHALHRKGQLLQIDIRLTPYSFHRPTKKTDTARTSFMLRRIVRETPDIIITGRMHGTFIARELHIPRERIFKTGLKNVRDLRRLRHHHRKLLEESNELLRPRKEANMRAKQMGLPQPFSKTGLLRRKRN